METLPNKEKSPPSVESQSPSDKILENTDGVRDEILSENKSLGKTEMGQPMDVELSKVTSESVTQTMENELCSRKSESESAGPTIELSSFLNLEQCQFLETSQQIFSCKQLASSDARKVARDLFEWYKSRHKKQRNASPVTKSDTSQRPVIADSLSSEQNAENADQVMGISDCQRESLVTDSKPTTPLMKCQGQDKGESFSVEEISAKPMKSDSENLSASLFAANSDKYSTSEFIPQPTQGLKRKLEQGDEEKSMNFRSLKDCENEVFGWLSSMNRFSTQDAANVKSPPKGGFSSDSLKTIPHKGTINKGTRSECSEKKSIQNEEELRNERLLKGEISHSGDTPSIDKNIQNNSKESSARSGSEKSFNNQNGNLDECSKSETCTKSPTETNSRDLHNLVSSEDWSLLASKWIFTGVQLCHVAEKTGFAEEDDKVRDKLQRAYRMWKFQKQETNRKDCGVHNSPSQSSASPRQAKDHPEPPHLLFKRELSIMFKKWFIDFLEENGIKTAPDLLSAKKSESSLLVASMMKFRADHDLSRVTGAMCSRYLKAMASRIQMTLSVEVSVDKKIRAWTLSPMVILNEMGRRFLTFKNLLTAGDFLKARTSELSESFEAWREENKLPRLKGKGANATVSGWKAATRDVLIVDGEADIGNRDYFADASRISARLKSRDSATLNDLAEADGSSAQPAGKERRSSHHLVDSCKLEMADFDLNSVLQGEQVEFLASQGIITASQLAAANKTETSPLVDVMVKWWNDKSNSEILPSFCAKSLHELLKQAKSSHIMKFGKPTPKRQRRVKSDVLDPFDAVSQTTREFLTSMGITSAEKFLATKTMDLAAAFVKWRASKGMVTLKGNGSIASVSGWKGSVRSALAERSKNMMSPDSSDSPEGNPRTRRQEPVMRRDISTGLKMMDTIHHLCFNSVDEATGVPFRSITVRKKYSDIMYEFRVEAGTCPGVKTDGMFLTYVGAKISKNRVDTLDDGYVISDLDTVVAPPITLSCRPAQCGSSSSPERASKQPDSNLEFIILKHDKFSSYFEGCGLVDLGSCGKITDSKGWPNSLFREFVLAGESKPFLPVGAKNRGNFISVHDIRLMRKSDTFEPNVVLTNDDGPHIALHITNPLEKGQVVELIADKDSFQGHYFQGSSELDMTSKTRREQNFEFRRAIVKTMSSLHVDRLTSALKDAYESLRTQRKRESYSGGPEFSKEYLSQQIIGHRRIHWTSELLRLRLSPMASGDRNQAENLSTTLAFLDEMKWTAKRFNADFRTEVVEALREEICHEILFTASGHVLSDPFDDARWCALSTKLLGEQLRSVVDYSILQHVDKFQAQKDLLKMLYTRTSETITRLLKLCDCVNGDQSALRDKATKELCFRATEKYLVSDYKTLSKFRSGSVSDGRSWNLFSLHPSATPKEVIANLADAHCLQDAVELLGMDLCLEMTQYEQDPTEEFTLVSEVKLEARFAVRNAAEVCGVPRKAEVFRAGLAKIHKNWYLVDQVLAVTHAVATAGVDWLYMNVHGVDEPVYSLEKLLKALRIQTSTVEVLMPDGTVVLMDEKSRIERLGVNHFSTTTNPVPKTLPVFFGLVWPLLSTKYKWQLQPGQEPGSYKFVLPSLTTEDKMLEADNGSKNSPTIKSLDITAQHRILKNLAVRSCEEEEGPSLPAEVSVRQALEKYFTFCTENLKPAEAALKGAFVEGIAKYFDKVLPTCLLRDSELARHERIKKSSSGKGKRYSDLYGCEYLLRLSILFPSLLRESSLPEREVAEVVMEFSNLLEYLKAQCREYFYDATDLPEEEEQNDGVGTNAKVAQSSVTKEEDTLPLEPYGIAFEGTAVKDSAVKDSAVKDSAVKDSAVKDSAMKDSAVKDLAVKDSAMRDTAVKDATIKDTAMKHPDTEDNVATEHAVSTEDIAATKDGATKDCATKDCATKDCATKDCATKDGATKDVDAMDVVMNDTETNDTAMKDIGTKETGDTQTTSALGEPPGLLLTDDKSLLTEFTYMIMQQVRLHLATASDLSKGKRRGLRIGSPGLCCIHCSGKKSEGNAFFSGSLGSIATVPSVIFTHLERCPFFPADFKRLLNKYRSQHQVQRAMLKHGSQSQFYSRLWDRMHGKGKTELTKPREEGEGTSEPVMSQNEVRCTTERKNDISVVEAFNVVILPETSEEKMRKERSNMGLGSRPPFDCHQDVLRYLDENEYWREEEDVRSRISAYFECVMLEGKLWHV